MNQKPSQSRLTFSRFHVVTSRIGRLVTFVLNAISVIAGPFPHLVIARESGRSSTPRPIVFKRMRRGLLDAPLRRGMTRCDAISIRTFFDLAIDALELPLGDRNRSLE